MEKRTKKDLVGMKFNRLEVIERTEKEGKSHSYWLCKCECNSDNSLKIVRQDGLITGSIKSCGCLNYENITRKRNNNTYEFFDTYFIIKINNKFGENEVYVDIEDFDSIKEYTWTCNKLGYVRTSYSVNYKKTQIMIHRLIMNMTKDDRNIYIDHIDGNPSNNRKYNLRIVTNQQNQYNATLAKSNTSGVKGVTFQKDTQKWRAAITINKEYKYLGEYTTKEEAIKVRQDAELKYYGDYSTLNREKVIQENIDKIESEKIKIII